jgi:hypothetical protein
MPSRIKHQVATFWWYINDFPSKETVISWRLPYNAFNRKKVWDQTQGLLDFGPPKAKK